MDLIILQPGDTDMVPAGNNWPGAASMIDGVADTGSKRDEDASLDWIADPLSAIELVSIHQGMKQQITTDVSNTARTSGRPVITDFTCTKYLDKTSVVFYDYCLRAKPMGAGAAAPTRIYICRNSGDQILNIMTFWLRDAIISEIQLQSHPDDMPTEQFKIYFSEIRWEYTLHTAAGVKDGVVSGGWSLAKNRPITEFTS